MQQDQRVAMECRVMSRCGAAEPFSAVNRVILLEGNGRSTTTWETETTPREVRLSIHRMLPYDIEYMTGRPAVGGYRVLLQN